MRPADSPHSPVDRGRCAQCGMRAGVQVSGDDLGALQDHPLDASAPVKRAVHAGCAGASLVARGSLDPLGPTPYARGGVSVVHVFEARGGSDPRERTERMEQLRARCGFETALPGAQVEWAVYVAGHPSACRSCAQPRDPHARAHPARFQVERGEGPPGRQRGARKKESA